MMSQKSAEINANANHPAVAIDVHIDKENTPRAKELLNGWGDWSLEDIVRIISSTKSSLSNRLKQLYILLSIRVWVFLIIIFST